MSQQSPRQLSLLADHLKLSLLERQRAIALDLEPTKQDSHITRSLSTLHQGLEALETQQADLGQPADDSSALSRLRAQYEDMHAQFHGAAPASAESRRPNDPALAGTFAAAAAGATAQPGRRGKSVRFRDDPNTNSTEEEEDAVEVANRAALFADTERYRDEPPEHADQSALDNRQIHAFHSQVLREQDEQLETLGRSVGRTRVLGIQMGDELEEQNELLGDVEAGVDRHTTTLERARKRLGHVARKSRDNWSWVTIGILIVVLVLLIVVLK